MRTLLFSHVYSDTLTEMAYYQIEKVKPAANKTDMTLAPSIVHVIVAADYGERLRDAPGDEAAWVAGTSTNHTVIKSIWATNAVDQHRGHLSGITSFQVAADETPEDWLLGVLNSVEEHHGQYSQTPPYSILRVIGTALTPRIRVQLESYDFVEFESCQKDCCTQNVGPGVN